MGLLCAQTSGPWRVGRAWSGCEGFLVPWQNACAPLGPWPRTRKQDGAVALGGFQGQLHEGEDLEESARGAAHMKSTHLQRGHLLHLHVISCRSRDDSGVAFPSKKLHLLDHRGRGQRWPIGMTHEQPLHHHLVEGGIGSSGWKPAQLDQQPSVDVLALELRAPGLLVSVVVNVHSHDGASCSTGSRKSRNKYFSKTKCIIISYRYFQF